MWCGQMRWEERHGIMPKSKHTQRAPGSGSQAKRPAPGNGGSTRSGATPGAGRPGTPASLSAAPARGATSAKLAPAPRGKAVGTASPQPRTRAALGTGAARRRQQRTPWWQQRRTLTIGGTVIGVALVVVLFVVYALNAAAGTAENAKLASASLVQAVTNVSPQVSDAVNTGGLPNPYHALPGATALNGPSGKPEVLYIGAEYCPFCAADRWSLIVALSRFGTFSNLHTITSSGNDSYPNTPTFTFYGSTYQSQYVDFVPVETSTRDPNTPLQTPTSDQLNILTKYDAPPYIPSTATTSAGSIPFLDIGNQYVMVGSGYSPQVLGGYTWDQIANALDNPGSPITKGIVGNANYITAAICKLTNNQPGSSCSSAALQQIEGQLPKGS